MKIQKDLKLDLSLEDILCIALQPTPEQTREFVKKKKLFCHRCMTDEYIVAEPVGVDQSGRLSRKIEYYCANVDNSSSVFSKCWNHVYAYFRGTRNLRTSTIEGEWLCSE